MDEDFDKVEVTVGLPSWTLDAGGVTVGGTDEAVVGEALELVVVVVVDEEALLVEVTRVVETDDDFGVADLVEVTRVVEDEDEERAPKWYRLRALEPPQNSEPFPLHIMLQPVLRTGVWLTRALAQSEKTSETVMNGERNTYSIRQHTRHRHMCNQKPCKQKYTKQWSYSWCHQGLS